jgi:hypothetical protein
MLGRSPTRDQTERGLQLTEDRRLSRREAHVGCQHELAADSPYATLDLCDGHEPAVAQVVEQKGKRRLACQLRRLGSVVVYPCQVDVGDEVVGVGALEHEHLDGVVGLRLLNQGDEIANQFGRQEVHGRRPNLHEQNGPLVVHGERLENHRISFLVAPAAEHVEQHGPRARASRP